MISPKVIRKLLLWTNHLHKYGIIPLKGNEGGIIVARDGLNFRFRNFSLWAWGFIFSLYQIYYFFQLINLVKSNPINYALVGWLFVFWIGYAWSLSVLVNLSIHGKQICAFMNEMFKLGKHFKELKTTKKSLDTMYLVFLFLKALGIVFLWMLFGVHLINADYKQYSTAELKWRGHNWMLFLFLIAVDTFTISWGVVLMLYEIGLVALYIIFTSQSLTLLRKSKLPTEVKLRLYTHLELVNQSQRQCYFNRIPHLVCCLVFCTVIGFVGLIRFHAIFSLFDLGAMFCFGLGGLIVLFGFLHFFGNIPKKCDKVLDPLRQENHQRVSKLWKSKVCSMRRFGIKNGPIHCMEYSALLIASSAITNLVTTIITALI